MYDDFCVGPAQIVRTNNQKIYVHDRAGSELYENETADWWQTVGSGSPGFLRFAFDPVQDRWIAAAVTASEQVIICLSHNENFLGKWTSFTFSASSVQGDESADLKDAGYSYLSLGFGGGLVAVSVLLDDYEGQNDDFAEDDSGFAIVVLGDIEGGTGSTPLTARQTVISHEDYPYEEGRPVPARTFSSGSGLYFLSLEDEEDARYGLSKLSFNGTNFSFSKNFSTFTVSSLASDSGRTRATQPSTTVRLGHADEGAIHLYHLGDAETPAKRQIRDVMLRDNLLWAVHEGIDEESDTVRTHWLSIRMDTTPRFVTQSGKIGGANGMCCIAPSIAVNANQDVLVGFTATGAHDFPSAAYAMRLAGDAAGTMRVPRKFVTGTTSYLNETWYYPDVASWPGQSNTHADPGDSTALWTQQAFQSNGSASRIAQVTGNVAPVITQHPPNRTVAPGGNTSLTVAATGTNLQYQWYLEDAPAGGGLNATININGMNALKTGYYKCRVSNAGGTVWSNTALVKLTTGNPGVFAFTNIAGDPLSSLSWTEPSESPLTLSYRTLNIRRTNGSDGRVRVAVNVRGRFAPPALTATAGWDFTGIVTGAPNSGFFSGPGALIFEEGETQKTVNVFLRRETMVEPSVETMEATMAVDSNLGAVTSTPQLDISLLDNDTSPTFVQAVDYNIPWTNEGNRWKPQSTVTSDGLDAVQSDITPPGGEPAAFSADFNEQGTLVYRWRAVGDAEDKLQLVKTGGFPVSTTIPAFITGSTDWQTAAITISGTFNTKTEWQFLRGAGSRNILASGYVDQVRFHSGNGGVVEFERPAYSVDEGAGTVAVTIRRIGYTSGSGTIGVTLQNGTATGGSDFQELGTALLSFAAGQASRTITFTVFPDQISEPAETFRAVLSEQGSGLIGIGPQGTATISIVDQPGETYATWAATKFTAAQLNDPAISGKEANPDNDALTNVLEYAFDGDPLSALSAPLPVSTFETVEGEDIVRHAMIFPRRKQSLDLTYKVQRTTDMAAWQDGAVLSPAGTSNFPGIVQLVSATGAPIEMRTVRDGVALNNGQRAWLRIHVICQ